MVAASCLGFPRPAVFANDNPAARDEARAKAVEGARLYSAGQFSEALLQFQAGYARFPSPKFFYNMGLAHLGMGKKALAWSALTRFLGEAKDASPEHLAHARMMIVELAKEVGFVDISSDAAGAQVLLDGGLIRSIPVPRTSVDAGRHEVIVRSEKHGTHSKAFVAVAGRPIVVRVEVNANKTVEPASGAALPTSAAQAEALLREATELRRAGKDARAYPLFQKAYETEPTPRTAAQLGLVEMQLGYWLLGEQHLLEALSFPRDPWISSNRASLEESLARARAAIGEVVVAGTPSGATVMLNSKMAGNLPLPAPIRVGEGPLKLEVRAPGHTSVHRSLTVHGGQRQEVVVALQAQTGVSPSSEMGGRTDAHRTAPVPHHVENAPGDDAATDRHPWGRMARPIGWTAAAVAAGSVAFGVFETLQWRSKNDEFARHSAAPRLPGQPTTCGVREQNRGAAGCSAIYADFARARGLAIAGYVAGGLLAAGAATLLVMSTNGTGGSVNIACGPGAGLAGTCRLVF